MINWFDRWIFPLGMIALGGWFMHGAWYINLAGCVCFWAALCAAFEEGEMEGARRVLDTIKKTWEVK